MHFKTIPAGEPIRIAFLGCGKITAKHAGMLRNWKQLQLYFASRDGKKARIYAQEFKGSGWFASYDEAILSAAVQTVFIATPPNSHLELALKAIAAGKHVIVEKPPFLSSAEMERVTRVSRAQGVQVMVAENYFYKPLRIKLRQLLESGAIGTTQFLLFNATKTQRNDDWRDQSSTAGGGALFEGGIHWINFMSNLGFDVEHIVGFRPGSSTSQDSNGLERSMQVTLKYRQGPVGTLLYSWESWAMINGLRLSRIYGSLGSITFESNGIFIIVKGKTRKIIFPGLADISGFRAMFCDFFKALQTGQPPVFDLELARRDLEMIEKAYASAEEMNGNSTTSLS
jgi:predicted dehydrogenase